MALAKNKINFTHGVLNNLPIPEKGKRTVFFDQKVSGLNVIVTDKGTKSFYLRKVIHGQSTRLLIGAYPDLSVERAREKANEMLSQIADGKNPHEERQKLKQEPTFAEMFSIFQDRHGKRYKRTFKQDERTFQNHLKKRFGNKKLTMLTRHDFQKMMMDISETHGEYAANKSLAIARSILNKAIEWGIFHKENPAAFVKSHKQKARDRFLQRDEMQRFLRVVNNEENENIRDFVRLCLFTGARKSNVMSMHWLDIDMNAHEWRIPITKNGKPHIVPLIPAAVTVLEQRASTHAKRGYVFPSHSASGHMMEPKKAWKRMLEKAEIKDFRIHDLRRTMGSYQAILGISTHIIGKSLGHESLAATQIYARLDQDPIRAAMSSAADLMISLSESDNR